MYCTSSIRYYTVEVTSEGVPSSKDAIASSEPSELVGGEYTGTREPASRAIAARAPVESRQHQPAPTPHAELGNVPRTTETSATTAA